MNIFNLTVILTSLSFLVYGVHCIISDAMKIEFKRYSLEKLRIVTGFLEILGGLGLLIGLEYTFILKLAALGLAMMMIAALFVRIKIKDSPLQSVPALTLLLINLFILFS